MFYLCSAWTFTFSMISIFTSSFWMFLACRFLLAFGRPTSTLIVYVHVTEIVKKEHRLMVGLMGKLGYIMGQLILPGLVWIFRDWFYIEIICVLPCVICLPSWWVTSESPRWLITQGKIIEAEKVMRKAIKINKLQIENFAKKFKNITEKIVKESEEKGKRVTFLNIMKNSHLRKVSLIFYIISITIVLSYYGLSFSAYDIGIDILLFFFLAAVVEIPASAVYFYLQKFIGRRYTLIVSMAGSGLMYLLAIAVQSGYPIILIAFTVISRFCTTISLSSLNLFATETYPTVVRNVGIGLLSMMGRVGSLAAPFMREAANNVHISFPLALFGTLSLICCVLTLLLPETKDSQLADMLSQVEDRKRNGLLVHGMKAENEEEEEGN
ncbi:solute carrier family 22 member 5-like [Centruroides sculpturatus]|uniref:solute carrier family 22 member 5-like n=2 Tax=Centruroides sculpturatus TaxID=218467 RepID=UPI000C6EA5A0|nr:solute carrier family 22 member 5-like [Centruroides sculpturatus]XP_023221480.1 solute carrier family 22 member 5-like [Centruroides sculpturatus]XP_023221481.1 solute carrier family 22 member 5-like [Centruroides sculpturatus]